MNLGVREEKAKHLAVKDSGWKNMYAGQVEHST